MRYLCYITPNEGITIVIVDLSSVRVSLYPARDWLENGGTRGEWIRFYEKYKNDENFKPQIIFEICEGQYKKFREQGIKPTNWDW